MSALSLRRACCLITLNRARRIVFREILVQVNNLFHCSMNLYLDRFSIGCRIDIVREKEREMQTNLQNDMAERN